MLGLYTPRYVFGDFFFFFLETLGERPSILLLSFLSAFRLCYPAIFSNFCEIYNDSLVIGHFVAFQSHLFTLKLTFFYWKTIRKNLTQLLPHIHLTPRADTFYNTFLHI